MRHYYFKFLGNNDGLTKWGTQYGIDKVELSIYYDIKDKLMWLANESEKAIKYFKENSASRSANQIELFYSLKKNLEDSYFWVFQNDKIYAFKGEDLDVKDGREFMIDYNGSRPKSIAVKLVKIFNKIELPEFFSNINSNQKYNRGTIAEFPINGPENKFATSLINGNILDINRSNFYQYLSPIEFETLVFLIFNQNGNYCSSFRGGTLKDYDLRVTINNNLNPSLLPITNGTHWIQIKKKLGNIKEFDGYVINVDENKSSVEKVLGIGWVRDVIEKNQYLIDWLKQTTFRGVGINYFNFNW
jgi:hypothetical protein